MESPIGNEKKRSRFRRHARSHMFEHMLSLAALGCIFVLVHNKIRENFVKKFQVLGQLGIREFGSIVVRKKQSLQFSHTSV